MLKNKCKVILLLVIVASLISSISFCTVEPRTSDNYDNEIMPISENGEGTTETNETEGTSTPKWVNNDLYLFGDKVEVNEIVDGNVFVFANEVVVNAEVGGDMFVCAKKFTVNGGFIYNSLFVVAEEVNIDGIVLDVYSCANKFTLGANGSIYRDLKAFGDTININGTVRRDAYLTASNYSFDASNGVRISGNLKYSYANDISIPEGIVEGSITRSASIDNEEESVASVIFSYIFKAINTLVYVLVIVLLSMWLAPKFVARVTSMDTKKAFVSLGIGIVAPIAIILALIILLLSTVFTDIALATTFIFIAICMSGTAFASIYFGNIFAKAVKWEGKVKFVLATLIASLIIWVISQIPFIGGIFGLLVALFGMGTLFVNAIYRKEDAKQEVVEDKAE